MHVNMDMPIVHECTHVQVMGVVDILADLKDHRQRVGGFEIGGDHLGKPVANMLGNITRVLFPLGVSLGRSGIVSPVVGLGDNVLGIALTERVGPVLPDRSSAADRRRAR